MSFGVTDSAVPTEAQQVYIENTLAKLGYTTGDLMARAAAFEQAARLNPSETWDQLEANLKKALRMRYLLYGGYAAGVVALIWWATRKKG